MVRGRENRRSGRCASAGKTISYSQNGSSSHTALLSLIDQYRVDAKPVATGGHPATMTMTMTGQIDIGRGAAPFGLDLVEEKGEIRIIARGSEIRARANQTVRVCVANLETLERGRRDRALHAGLPRHARLDVCRRRCAQDLRGILQSPAALMAKSARDEYFPKATLWPDEVKGLDLVLADALKNKFIAAAARRPSRCRGDGASA